MDGMEFLSCGKSRYLVRTRFLGNSLLIELVRTSAYKKRKRINLIKLAKECSPNIASTNLIKLFRQHFFKGRRWKLCELFVCSEE